MGGVSSKQPQSGAGNGANVGAQRSDLRGRLARMFSRGSSPAREGKGPDGRTVRIHAPLEPDAGRGRLAVAPDPSAQAIPRSPPRRVTLPLLDTGTSPANNTPAESPPRTPSAHPPAVRRDGLTAALSQLLPLELPAAPDQAVEAVDLSAYTPAQAAEWIEDQAVVLDGAAMGDDHLEILCTDIEAAAKSLSPAHLQAMGRALGQVFNPGAGVCSSSMSSSSSLSTAIAGPQGYAGLKRLLLALLARPQQALSPEQAGAFVQGMRLSLPPLREGADAVFRRAICEAQRAGTPSDTVIAMTCGWVSAMVDPAVKAWPYTPAQLPPGPKSEALQAALNIGKRLALNPASLFDPDVKASRDKRFDWLMIAYRMPHPQSNESRLAPARRNYTRRVFPLLTAPQRLALLAAYNQTRHLGPLRNTKAEGKAS